MNHLYYFNIECIAFPLFDDSVPQEAKLKLAQKIIAASEEQEKEEEETEVER